MERDNYSVRRYLNVMCPLSCIPRVDRRRLTRERGRERLPSDAFRDIHGLLLVVRLDYGLPTNGTLRRRVLVMVLRRKMISDCG
jgi:hypothetical protein